MSPDPGRDVITRLLTTKALRPADQLAAWQEWFAPTFDVTGRQPAAGAFVAENSVWNIGDLMISRMSAPPVLSLRTKKNIAKNPVDHWALTLCRQGTSNFRTPKATLTVPRDTVFVWSLGEYSECERPYVERFQIFVPRDSGERIGSALDAARGSVLNSPLGGLLADYMAALERWLPSVDPECMSQLNAGIHSMIAACIVPSAENLDLANDEIRRGQLERVRRAVQKHLRLPSLGPGMLCQIAGISRSQLYRLFEHVGGVASYIRRRRLLNARAIILDPENHRTISAIANDFCFEDASAFSRAFRREFGYTPNDLRSAERLGRRSATSHPPASRRQRFSDLLWETFK